MTLNIANLLEAAAAVPDRDAVTSGDRGPTYAEALREHCRTTIAGYKGPATISFVPEVVRSPIGKADYRWTKRTLAT